MNSTVLALDVGERKIGIARANTIARIAEPLTTLKNDKLFKENLENLLKKHNVSKLIVGLPRGLDGQETKQTKYVKSFVKSLHINIQIIFQDEALTSVNSKQLLDKSKKPYNKEDIDAGAASIILDDYLRENL